MRLGNTNKIHQDINENFGDNAELLEQRLKEINWRYFGKIYGIGFCVLLLSIFISIVVVRIAFLIL